MQSFGLGFSELLILLLTSGVGLPLGMPPLPPDQAIIRSAPEECLYYMSWAGTATPDATSKNHTEQLLAEPEIQQFAGEVERQLLDALNRNLPNDPAARTVATTLPPLVKKLLMRPGALYLSQFSVGPGGADIQGALVVNVGSEAAGVKASVEQLEGLVLNQLAPFGGPTELNVDDVKLKKWPIPPGAPEVAWGFKGNYFVFAIGGTAKGVVQRLDATREMPAWLSRIYQNLPVERPALVSHVNIASVYQKFAPFISDPTVPAAMEATGLSKVKSISSIAGLHGAGMVTRTLLAIDGEPTGILASLAGEPLTAADLAAVPADANIAGVLRMDLAEVYQRALEGLGQVNPQARDMLTAHVAQLEQQLGISIRQDLLEGLGDSWAVYNSPQQGGAWLTGLGASAALRNRDRFLAAHDNVLQGLRAQLESQGNPQFAIKDFRYLDHDIYYLQSLRESVPVAPAWCVSENRLLVALYPQMIKAMLARRADTKSLADNEAVAEQLAGGPVMISYQDTATILPTLYSVLQAFAPVAIKELNKQGVAVDLSILPAFPAIGKHAGPTIGLVRRTQDGIVSEQYATVPGGNLIGALPVIGGVGYFSARSAHVAAPAANAQPQAAPAVIELQVCP